MEIKAQFCSSLAKVFPDKLPELQFTGASALRGERYSFQLAYTAEHNRGSAHIKVDSALPVSVRKVELVPVRFCGWEQDEGIISGAPGLYPDYLAKPDNGGKNLPLMLKQYRSAWFTVDIPADCPPGKYAVTVELNCVDYSGITGSWTGSVEIEVIDAVLPPLEMKYTCWLHGDCLASVYHTQIFSEKYWEILGNFIDNAVKHGINMLLTPLLTPPLDTEPGKERPTNQLVQIDRKNGKYLFDFSRVEKFVQLAMKKGIKYFEIPPLFTQWGAAAAPKVVIRNAEGKEEQIFGWHTPSNLPEYRSFLTELLTEFTGFLKQRSWEKLFVFHCSDEPAAEHLPTYRDCQKFLQDLLPEFTVMDALSSVEFYHQQIIQEPVVSISKLDDFIDAGMSPGWIYYCCNPQTVYPNRFINMPSSRNRVIGLLFYRYGVKGFLHWGFNFYYSYLSRDVLDPFFSTDAGGNYPAGDPFLVYPGTDGVPEDSIRHEVFYEALQDLRALKLLEQLTGRKAVEEFLDSCTGNGTLKMNNYPKGEARILDIRQKINSRIKNFSNNSL